jgi:hypothetical protein
MTLTATRPTIGGHQPLVVGKARYGVPRGSKVAHVTRGSRRMVWVLDLDRRVHAFTETGEVGPIPEPLQALVRERIFKLQT